MRQLEKNAALGYSLWGGAFEERTTVEETRKGWGGETVCDKHGWRSLPISQMRVQLGGLPERKVKKKHPENVNRRGG